MPPASTPCCAPSTSGSFMPASPPNSPSSPWLGSSSPSSTPSPEKGPPGKPRRLDFDHDRLLGRALLCEANGERHADHHEQHAHDQLKSANSDLGEQSLA